MLVRSHECVKHGFDLPFDGAKAFSQGMTEEEETTPAAVEALRCVTVFSASNYGGSCYNAGAILVWEKGEIDAHEV